MINLIAPDFYGEAWHDPMHGRLRRRARLDVHRQPDHAAHDQLQDLRRIVDALDPSLDALRRRAGVTLAGARPRGRGAGRVRARPRELAAGSAPPRRRRRRACRGAGPHARSAEAQLARAARRPSSTSTFAGDNAQNQRAPAPAHPGRVLRPARRRGLFRARSARMGDLLGTGCFVGLAAALRRAGHRERWLWSRHGRRRLFVPSFY